MAHFLHRHYTTGLRKCLSEMRLSCQISTLLLNRLRCFSTEVSEEKVSVDEILFPSHDVRYLIVNAHLTYSVFGQPFNKSCRLLYGQHHDFGFCFVFSHLIILLLFVLFMFPARLKLFILKIPFDLDLGISPCVFRELLFALVLRRVPFGQHVPERTRYRRQTRPRLSKPQQQCHRRYQVQELYHCHGCEQSEAFLPVLLVGAFQLR